MTDELDFVIINIGRNFDTGSPMSKPEWVTFINTVRNFLTTQGAQVIGQGHGSSQYVGTKEEFATFHALIPPTKHDSFRNYFAGLARYYGQDSIAYVISTPDALVYASKPLETYL